MQRIQKIHHPTTDMNMPDPRNINTWMGHCGGTDPYCQQGCSPTCANYTYMTGIEAFSACKDPSADTMVGKFGVGEASQPRVGQGAVQEAMRKVQEGHAQTRTQSMLPQHQARSEGQAPAILKPSGMGSTSIVTPTSVVVNFGDDKQSFNNINLTQHNVVNSIPHTAPENTVADEDKVAEFEVDGQQKGHWTGTPRRPPGPV